jgi:uncharacterized SAM-binding protein YcdF (DUF218 family)
MWKLAALIVVAVIAYPAWLSYQIWDRSHRDELHSADAIVVLGAAQYNGRPSSVFKARLDQAVYLYEESLSAKVVVTGGKHPGDRFTEAEAGANYLVGEGVPGNSIVRENEGRSSLESLTNLADMAGSQEISSVLLVSDPMHSERIKRMAEDLGFDEVFTSPASYVDLNRSRTQKARELLYEVGSLLAYEFLER